MSPTYSQLARGNYTENTKANEAKYKQLVNLHTGYMGITCAVLANTFCMFEIVSRH